MEASFGGNSSMQSQSQGLTFPSLKLTPQGWGDDLRTYMASKNPQDVLESTRGGLNTERWTREQSFMWRERDMAYNPVTCRFRNESDELANTVKPEATIRKLNSARDVQLTRQSEYDPINHTSRRSGLVPSSERLSMTKSLEKPGPWQPRGQFNSYNILTNQDYNSSMCAPPDRLPASDAEKLSKTAVLRQQSLEATKLQRSRIDYNVVNNQFLQNNEQRIQQENARDLEFREKLLMKKSGFNPVVGTFRDAEVDRIEHETVEAMEQTRRDQKAKRRPIAYNIVSNQEVDMELTKKIDDYNQHSFDKLQNVRRQREAEIEEKDKYLAEQAIRSARRTSVARHEERLKLGRDLLSNVVIKPENQHPPAVQLRPFEKPVADLYQEASQRLQMTVDLALSSPQYSPLKGHPHLPANPLSPRAAKKKQLQMAYSGQDMSLESNTTLALPSMTPLNPSFSMSKMDHFLQIAIDRDNSRKAHNSDSEDFSASASVSSPLRRTPGGPAALEHRQLERLKAREGTFRHMSPSSPRSPSVASASPAASIPQTPASPQPQPPSTPRAFPNGPNSPRTGGFSRIHDARVDSPRTLNVHA